MKILASHTKVPDLKGPPIGLVAGHVIGYALELKIFMDYPYHYVAFKTYPADKGNPKVWN